MKTDLSVARLRELLHYDPETGVFTWLVSPVNNIKAGSRAGRIVGSGHRQISVDGCRYYANVLAWFYVKGLWPEDKIDHKNGDPDANWFSNLRPATSLQNGHNQKIKTNNTSGCSGVHWYKKGSRWMASITYKGRRIHLGYFVKIEDAISARKQAEIKYFGEFRRSA